MLKRGVFRRLAQVVPLLIIRYGLDAVPNVPDSAVTVVAAIVAGLVALFVVLAISATLSAMEDLYQTTPRGRGNRSRAMCSWPSCSCGWWA